MNTPVPPSCDWPGISFKLRIEALSGRDRQIAHGHVGRLSITREGIVRFEAAGAVVLSPTPVPLGRWVQIEVSRHAVSVTPSERSPS